MNLTCSRNDVLEHTLYLELLLSPHLLALTIAYLDLLTVHPFTSR